MAETEFLRPRFVGPRFEEHSIPLEVLGDLAALEAMILEMAKHEFLKANPNRERSPRHFTEGISLKLTAVEAGSAIPVIALSVSTDMLFPSDIVTWLEKGRDSVLAAIKAATNPKEIFNHVPKEKLGWFDRIGRSLRGDEAIEFTSPDGGAVTRLTLTVRRALLLASDTVKDYTEDVTLRAAICEADQAKMTFQLQEADGHKIFAPLAPQHLDPVLKAFAKYKQGYRVLLQGVGKFNRSKRLESFESIEHINELDPLDVGMRLEELANLKDGWLEGEGKAPASDGLIWLRGVFNKYYSEEAILPRLYPTVEGGIQAEWKLGQIAASLEIDIETHNADWFQVDLTTDVEESKKALNLDFPESWKWLVARIVTLGGAAE